ncbi:MAG: L-seryl-tRNA(Sec) selenium transferase [Desulfococcaceae bacterium]|nr:L-seryl-tRNA(Sec) selenium transferase [Desulfococcaceae bacterium]
MEISGKQQQLLQKIPGVDRMLEIAGQDIFFEDIPKNVLTDSIRAVMDSLRHMIRGGEDVAESMTGDTSLLHQVKLRVTESMTYNLRPLINASGVVVHTNLGRSRLAEEALENVKRISAAYSNLEFDLKKGVRGIRYSCIEELLCRLTGAEAAMAVNNNAGAVLLCLDTFSRGKEAIVSRGELVEIGGSFRIPDVMAKSGALLKEVGTTNRTHIRDYASAVGENTGLLLKVHMSNYSIVGFTASVSLEKLVALGKECGIPVMEDLGSGTLIDFSPFGMQREPTVQDSVKAGAGIVTFSGDKLLGGPQAGMIAGKKEFIAALRKNPLTRALRLDKMTLAALESTLRLYRDGKALEHIPTLRMLTRPLAEITRDAEELFRQLNGLGKTGLYAELMNLQSRAGGGALPLQELPSKGVGIKIQGMSVNRLEEGMRENTPPLIGRIENDLLILDMRTVLPEEIRKIVNAVRRMMQR